MRQTNSSEQYSRQNINKESRMNGQNEIENYDYDDESVNCPLIFKTCLLVLVTCGILAFVITFGVQIDTSPSLGIGDFTTCGDQQNVRRLTKSYAYEKIILGLLISAVVISFGLTVFMLYLSYTYCQCFGDCIDYSSEPSQSQLAEDFDLNQYQIELKKRITANILIPKSQIRHQNQRQKLKRRNDIKQQQEQKIQNRKIEKRRKFKKSREEIERFNENYAKYIKNSQSDQCDCQCDDCGECMAYCLGCLWCRSCFDAHHYHFYNSKNEEYSYWIVYMVKTLLFGAALAYVIRIYVSLKQIDYCSSSDSKIYTNNIEVPMIIGIVTAVIDVFGYIHLFVQGTLLQMVESTLHEKSKSQHSDSDSDGQQSDHHKKQGKKYQKSQQSYEGNNQQHKNIAKKSMLKKQSQSQQQQFQNPTDDNLLRTLKFKKEEKQAESKDTDSFFIKLKTLGNKYLDSIEDEPGQNEQKSRTKSKKYIQPSQESHQDSNNEKPRIYVPQNIDRLDRKTVPPVKRMQRQQPQQQQQSSLRQSIKIERTQPNENQPQKQNKQGNNVYSQFQNTKTTYGKFGSFNRDNKHLQQHDKLNNESAFQRLSKFSTNF